MDNFFYLSSKDRNRLADLIKIIPLEKDLEQKNLLEQEKTEILDKRKKLVDCSVMELEEARVQLNNQYKIVRSVGGMQQHYFKETLNSVSNLINNKMLEQIENPTLEEDLTRKKVLESKKKEGKKNRYSWIVNVEDDSRKNKEV